MPCDVKNVIAPQSSALSHTHHIETVIIIDLTLWPSGETAHLHRHRGNAYQATTSVFTGNHYPPQYNNEPRDPYLQKYSLLVYTLHINTIQT